MSADRIVLVTGASSGLGLHCVQSLVSKHENTIVLLACRNLAAAMQTVTSIVSATACDAQRLIVLPDPCDLADLNSVRAYAIAVKRWLDGRRIAALVNNAGVGGSATYSTNAAGHETIFASNHLGHFLLTILLLPLMREHGRIVNVSSEVHDKATNTPLPDPAVRFPQSDEEYQQFLLRGEPFSDENARNSGLRRYSRSKLCNVLFTNELAFRLSGDLPWFADDQVKSAPQVVSRAERAACTLSHARSLRVVAFNPGMMLDSNFIASSVGWAAGWLLYLLQPLVRFTPLAHLQRSQQLSGERLARLALGTLCSTDGAATAAYVQDEAVLPSSEYSRSLNGVQSAATLWRHSMQWSQCTAAEQADAGF